MTFDEAKRALQTHYGSDELDSDKVRRDCEHWEHVEVDPYPDYVEMGDETYCTLLKAAHVNDIGAGTQWADGMRTFPYRGIRTRVRTGLVGWRVVGIAPSSDITEKTFGTATITVDRNGDEVRNVIASPDFDETEALRFEARREAYRQGRR